LNVLIPHLNQVQHRLGRLPCRVVADAGYGCEENYAYLEQTGAEGYVKYPHFDKQQKRSWHKQHLRVENWKYDPARDEYTCLAWQPLTYQRTYQRITTNGYPTIWRVYECGSCISCSLKPQCTRGVGKVHVLINPILNHYQEQAS
jgi:hypothetical protein